jgi:hypothetical protein
VYSRYIKFKEVKPKEEEQGFAVAVFLGTHNGYIFFPFLFNKQAVYMDLNRQCLRCCTFNCDTSCVCLLARSDE